MSKIEGLLDGRGYVTVETVCPESVPIVPGDTESRTREYLIAKAARTSTGGDLKSIREDKNLIKYLFRNRHTSPFEMGSMTFCIKCPIAVGRQFLRHRTGKFNEFSQRYSEVGEEMGRFDMRTPTSLRGQSKMNAQGSEDNLSSETSGKILDKLQEVEAKLDDVYKDYQELVSLGLAREVARFCLPLSTYTIFYLQLDLNNLCKFLTLRMAPDAQYEIQVYAKAMFELTKEYFPIVMEALEEELEKVVLDKWAIKMIQEKKIPDELRSKSLRKRLEELAEKLKIELK
jgi:thymidylate synthase (FAD)